MSSVPAEFDSRNWHPAAIGVLATAFAGSLVLLVTCAILHRAAKRASCSDKDAVKAQKKFKHMMGFMLALSSIVLVAVVGVGVAALAHRNERVHGSVLGSLSSQASGGSGGSGGGRVFTSASSRGGGGGAA